MSETPQVTVQQALTKHQRGPPWGGHHYPQGWSIGASGHPFTTPRASTMDPQGTLAAAPELPMTTHVASTKHPLSSSSPPPGHPLATPKASARCPQGSDEPPQGLRPTTPKATIHCPPAVQADAGGCGSEVLIFLPQEFGTPQKSEAKSSRLRKADSPCSA